VASAPGDVVSPLLAATERTRTDPAAPRRTDGTDAMLIRRSWIEPATFAAIFDRHWPAIHAYCTSRAGAVGEDLAAEVFRVAFDDRRRFDVRHADARPWLYGIATNLIRNHFRRAERAGRATVRAGRADARREADPIDDALGRVEAERLGPRLAAAMHALPAADRDALLLLAWAELTYEQIGLALDIPIGTVRSRIHRARTRVQAHLTTTEDER
jgi:RNA polymerase sigma-70 factor (ECF subfamily)